MRSLALAAIGLALATGVAAASSQADVTLAMRQYTNANKIPVFVWYGQVGTAAAGEDVEVLGRACLTKDYRLYAGTKTVAGGGWEVESASIQPPYNIVDVNSGTTFRARWRDQLSNTILHNLPENHVRRKTQSSNGVLHSILVVEMRDAGLVIRSDRRVDEVLHAGLARERCDALALLFPATPASQVFCRRTHPTRP